MDISKLCVSYLLNVEDESLVREVAADNGITHFEAIPSTQDVTGAVSMQSILPSQAKDIFTSWDGDHYRWEYWADYLIGEISSSQVSHFVFGCPKAKGSTGMLHMQMAEAFIKEFFEKISKSIPEGKTIGIENTPRRYGTTFFTHPVQISNFLYKFNAPNVKMNLDLGGLIAYDGLLSNELDPKWIPYVSHVHVSRFMLQPISTLPEYEQAQYCKWIGILIAGGYDGYFSLEVKLSNPSLKEMDDEVKAFVKLMAVA